MTLVPYCFLTMALMLGQQRSTEGSRHRRQTSNAPDRYVYVRPLDSQANPPQAQPTGFLPYRPPLVPPSGVQFSVSTNVQSSPQVQRYQPPLPLQQPDRQTPLTQHPQLQQQDLAQLLQRLQQQQQFDVKSLYLGGQQTTPSSPQNAGGQSMSITTSYTADVIRQGKADKQPAIQKAPASEIQGTAAKGASGKDKAAADDEYVVYYYYYYDDDAVGKNLTLNFDDIPNLEQYDSSKRGESSKKVTDRGLGSRAQHNLPPNSIQGGPSLSDDRTLSRASPPPQAGFISGLVPDSPLSDTSTETTSAVPISNVFRYGSGDIPRVPVTPNIQKLLPSSRQPLTATESVPSTVAPVTEGSTTTVPPTTTIALTSVASPSVEQDDDVLRSTEDVNDIEVVTHTEENVQETTETETTTVSEPTTTTEETTTTTERAQRPRFNNRRRGPSSGRAAGSRSPPRSTSTTTTTTTTSATPRRGGASRFSSSRVRRPSFSSSRIRSRTEETTREDGPTESTTRSSATSSAAPRRFGSSPQSRRFGGTRAGSSSGRSVPTTSTSTTTTSRSAVRSRPTPASRSGIFGGSRSRSRPSFFRSRQKIEKQEEVEQEATTVESSFQTPESTARTAEPPATTEEDGDLNDEYDDSDATVAPTTTTERNRAVFRPRPRPPLFSGGRSRPSPLIRSRSR